MLKFWNITILEIQAPVSSERDEWEGGWVGGVGTSVLATLVHSWEEYSLLHGIAHSTSNPRNLFFLYLFFFLLSMFRKNNFHTDCVPVQIYSN